ncbi:hypothetical protein SAMN02745866_03072 [Alteromonadaceae bacterium Bs31]|nr:hypothetical protein SAMN02745866_03072 [Alteromonadaceae bacterium Bs31]
MIKLLSLSLILLCVVGCTTQSTRYKWGNYSDGLYHYYQEPAEHSKIRARLVTHIENLEKQEAVVPPGLYAEVGTYFLEAGDSTSAVIYYQKEYEAWPESRDFMSALITNLQGRTNSGP